MRRIPQEVRESQITDAANLKGHIFKGFLGGYVNKDSRLIIECTKHGEWNPTISNYLKNNGCAKCHVDNNRLKNAIDRVKSKLPNHVKFISLCGEYINQNSKVLIECEVHGRSTKSVTDIINKNSFCKKCGRESVGVQRRLPLETVINRVVEKCQLNGYEFLSFVDSYKGKLSSIRLECKDHGVWETKYDAFMGSRYGCPNCRHHGYKPDVDGYLYILRSTCGQFMKIGITNDPDTRLNELKWYTPFEFNNIELMKSNGKNVQVIEKGLHTIYESAQMKGFNGATEWFKWDSSVVDMMR